MTIQDTTAYVYGECKTYNTCDINLKMELQKYANNKWTTIATYSDFDDAKEFDLSKTRTVAKEYSYQVKLMATVNNQETVVCIVVLRLVNRASPRLAMDLLY